MTPPSLPYSRPTSDTYGPDLQNDGLVTRPTYELDATAWNRAKADLAAAALMVHLVRARVTNAGTAAVADATPIAAASITATRVGAGHVQVTMPNGLVPRFASFSCPVANTVCTWSYAIAGQVIDVYTFVSSGPIALTDVDFVIEVS